MRAGIALIDFQPHLGAEIAHFHALFDGDQQVGGFLLFNLQVGIARDAEGVGIARTSSPAKRVSRLAAIDFFQPDEGVAGELLQ